jgi:exodeoxyribonuclease V alpha subunit
MHFLQEMGINASLCSKIYAEYGPDSVDLIRQDPYRLADDFPGEGFFIADSIAPMLGMDVNAAERARACILHMIYQICDDGHSFAEVENLLARCENQFQIERHQLERAIDELVAAESIVVEPYAGEIDTRVIYLIDLYRAEVGLAARLRALMSVPLPPPEIDADRILSAVQKKLALTLSSEQLSVLEQIFAHRIAIITGGPGTGKTTLLRSISTVFEAMGKQVSLAAPTGRAARRLAEMTARNAKTIHRLLGYNFVDGGFIRNRDNPLGTDAIIIDEASMVDIFLMYHLLNAVPRCRRLPGLCSWEMFSNCRLWVPEVYWLI